MKYRKKEPMTKEDTTLQLLNRCGRIAGLLRITNKYGLKLMRHAGEFICVRSSIKKHKPSERGMSLRNRKWA